MAPKLNQVSSKHFSTAEPLKPPLSLHHKKDVLFHIESNSLEIQEILQNSMLTMSINNTNVCFKQIYIHNLPWQGCKCQQMRQTLSRNN